MVYSNILWASEIWSWAENMKRIVEATEMDVLERHIYRMEEKTLPKKETS